LSFWHWDSTADTITNDSQNAYITNTNGVILQTIFHQCENGQTWLNTTVDMTPYAGQTVRVKFVVHQNGAGGLTGMYVDDVVLATQCAAPSPTPTPTPRVIPDTAASSYSSAETVKFRQSETFRSLAISDWWSVIGADGSRLRCTSETRNTQLGPPHASATAVIWL
jgi:Immune inhibitor A peptidase M6.